MRRSGGKGNENKNKMKRGINERRRGGKDDEVEKKEKGAMRIRGEREQKGERRKE
jgi:hypothetical protein